MRANLRREPAGLLGHRLMMHRERCGHPPEGPLFQHSRKAKLNLNKLRMRHIMPALNRCRDCGGQFGKRTSAKPTTLNATRVFRAGGAGARFGGAVAPSQRILRHSDVNTTRADDIKPMEASVHAAIAKLQAELPAKNAAAEYSRSTAEAEPDGGPELINRFAFRRLRDV